MIKWRIVFLASCLVLLLPLALSNAENKFKLFFNNKETTINAFEVNGVTYVPVRFFAENFGANVSYQEPNIVRINYEDAPVVEVGKSITRNYIEYTVETVEYKINDDGVRKGIVTLSERKTGDVNFTEMPKLELNVEGRITSVNPRYYKEVGLVESVEDDYRRFIYEFDVTGNIYSITYLSPLSNGTFKRVGNWIAEN